MKPGLITWSLLLLASFPGQAASDGGMAGPQTLDRLRAGEVLVENTRTDESGGSARVRFLVRAPAEVMWSVFMSCPHAFIFVDGMQVCEVLEESETYVQTRQVVDRGWLVPEQDYTFETRRKPYSDMQFKLIEGSLQVLEGSWDLQTIPEGVIVTHEIRVRPKFPVPRWLIRRTITRGMPDTMACIRGLAEREANGEARAEDLERCAGPGS
jgi:ribosome-associated toxin RatA of RatAB toxin-antitoxin module